MGDSFAIIYMGRKLGAVPLVWRGGGAGSPSNTVSPVFWKYINSERQIHDNIGDLKTFDKDGNMRTACTDSDKAEVLGNFFAGVFNRESEFVEATAQPVSF